MSSYCPHLGVNKERESRLKKCRHILRSQDPGLAIMAMDIESRLSPTLVLEDGQGKRLLTFLPFPAFPLPPTPRHKAKKSSAKTSQRIECPKLFSARRALSLCSLFLLSISLNARALCQAQSNNLIFSSFSFPVHIFSVFVHRHCCCCISSLESYLRIPPPSILPFV